MSVIDNMVDNVVDKLTGKKSNKKNTQKDNKEEREKAVQEWIPFHDIGNNIVYRRDNVLLIIIKIKPIKFDLLSKNEQNRRINSLYEVINGMTGYNEVIVMPRPINLDGYIADLHSLAKNIDQDRKWLLKEYISCTANITAEGTSLTKDFYCILQQPSNSKYAIEELKKKAYELKEALENVEDLKVEICTDSMLRELNFIFFNPVQAAYERMSYAPKFPTIMKERGKK